MSKRCTNCGKFPFCKDIKDPRKENNCDRWIKRILKEVKYGKNNFIK